jgi:hypothetical protein
MKKIRRKCATVAPYSMLYRFLCNALQRASQKAKKYGANAPQLRHIWPQAAPGAMRQHLFPLSIKGWRGGQGVRPATTATTATNSYKSLSYGLASRNASIHCTTRSGASSCKKWLASSSSCVVACGYNCCQRCKTDTESTGSFIPHTNRIGVLLN